MPSAFIPSIFSYPAVPLAWQLVHHWYVHPGPLVLRTDLLKLPTPTTDRDRTVSRRSEPSSRITKPDFRPCSTCWSRSQTPFCLCTLRLISIQAEGIFGRLRYSLGGDRPSQTAHLTLSRCQFHGIRLELQYKKSSIPTLTPHTLACMSLSLLPILYILHQSPISSYSKAPWGLSV